MPATAPELALGAGLAAGLAAGGDEAAGPWLAVALGVLEESVIVELSSSMVMSVSSSVVLFMVLLAAGKGSDGQYEQLDKVRLR